MQRRAIRCKIIRLVLWLEFRVLGLQFRVSVRVSVRVRVRVRVSLLSCHYWSYPQCCCCLILLRIVIVAAHPTSTPSVSCLTT